METALRPRRNNLSIALLSTAAFCSAAGTCIADLLLSNIAAIFHSDVSRAAIISWGFTSAYGLRQLFREPLGDRFGKYRLVAAVTLYEPLATVLSAIAGSIWSLGATQLPLWAMPAPIAFCGLGYYMFHNTLQTHATQMAPAVRGVAVSVSVFSSCFFSRQVARCFRFRTVGAACRPPRFSTLPPSCFLRWRGIFAASRSCPQAPAMPQRLNLSLQKIRSRNGKNRRRH